MKKCCNPVFSGKKEDLNKFVDSILEAMTLKELAYYAYNGMAHEEMNTESGLHLPPGECGGVDAVAGTDTDLPMPIHIGQSWNRELAKEVGEVIGNELRGKKKASNPNTLMFTAIADVRSNPLSGRFYEGYSEDPYLAAEMVDHVGNGCIGDDDFYIKAQVGSKHYCVYHSEWNRASESNYVSARALMDYHIPPFVKGFKNGHLVGVMTSYGGTNGMTNITFPYLDVLAEKYPYSLLNISDCEADTDTLRGQGNGYDPVYTVENRMLASMLIKQKIYAGNRADQTTFLKAVEEGAYGLKRKDLEEFIRPQIELWVRSGYFNPKDYPYTKMCLDHSPIDHNDELSQDVALRAAREGIVLLKNNGLLPLSGDKNVLVTGMFCDTRVQTHYSTPTPKDLEYSGMTPAKAYEEYMERSEGSLYVVPEMSGSHIQIFSEEKGGYLSLEDLGKEGKAPAEFTVYDFGMNATAFYNKATDTFLTYQRKNGVLCLERRNPEKTPSCFLIREDSRGLSTIKCDVFLTGFWDRVEEYHNNEIPFYERYHKAGKYVTYTEDNGLTVREEECEGAFFRIDKISGAGAGAEDFVHKAELAVLFIGANSFVQASEMIDRPDFEIGKDQIALVETVARQFPGKTVVVVKSDFPLNLAAIEENPDVAAILYESYAGQYDSWALIETLYGSNSPSGHLSATWYKTMDVLPRLCRREGIDDEYTVDMKNASPEETGLTYMYHCPQAVLYPFGYGLSYAQFAYSNICVKNGLKPLAVDLTVTNTGKFTGKEVVQIYLSSLDSGYGDYVPGKQLVGFAKTKELKPGDSQKVHIDLYEDAYRKWDVAAKKYIVETGNYLLSVARCAEDVVYETQIHIEGEALGLLDFSSPCNVWESVSAAKAVKGAEISKKRSVYFEGGYFAVESDGADSQITMQRVRFDHASKLKLTAACAAPGASLEIYIGEKCYALSVCETKPKETVLEEQDQIVCMEIAYAQNELLFEQPISGIYKLTIRFNQPGIRLSEIQVQ